MLKDLIQCRIRLILLVVHHNADIAHCSCSCIPSWSVTFVLSHGGVDAKPRIGRAPSNIPAWFDRVIEIAVGEDRAVQSVPRTTQSA